MMLLLKEMARMRDVECMAAVDTRGHMLIHAGRDEPHETTMLRDGGGGVDVSARDVSMK